MNRMLVVVFHEESKAYEGADALLQLDADGTITLFAYAVLAKSAEGTTSVKVGDHTPPIGTLMGTSLGALIGLMGGPAGMAIGTAAGLAVGAVGDFSNARIGDDFVENVKKALSPNTVALAAEIGEDSTNPVDTRMEAIGGSVFRRTLSKATEAAHEKELAAMRADLAQFKAEAASERGARRERIQEKIQQLESRIQGLMQTAKERQEAVEHQAQAKAKILKSKAETTRANRS